MKPNVAVVVRGGAVRDVVANSPVNVVVIDFDDTEAAGGSGLEEIKGMDGAEKAFVSRDPVRLDPEFMEQFASTEQSPATSKLMPFAVTLVWNPSNSGDGDYSTNTWALNHDEAILNVAEEMADHQDSGIEEGDEAGRAAFIQGIVRNVGGYAIKLGDTISSDLQVILAGPSGEMSAQAREDHEQIMAILAQYGLGQ